MTGMLAAITLTVTDGPFERMVGFGLMLFLIAAAVAVVIRAIMIADRLTQ